jgi:hypothetical protein
MSRQSADQVDAVRKRRSTVKAFLAQLHADPERVTARARGQVERQKFVEGLAAPGGVAPVRRPVLVA